MEKIVKLTKIELFYLNMYNYLSTTLEQWMHQWLLKLY